MSAETAPYNPIVFMSRQLLDSSVWEEDPRVRVLWVTLLFIASEPGRRGTIDMTVRALAGRACLSPEDTRYALDVLMAPDAASRSRENDGRRVVPLDPARGWGWKLVNWQDYEQGRVRMFAAARASRFRDRERTSNDLEETSVTQPLRSVTERDEALPVTFPHVKGEVRGKEGGSKEEEPTKERGTRFAPPSVEEVRALVAEKGYSFDPEAFVAFYESNGWKVGNHKMKSWTAACVTWQKRQEAAPTRPAPGALPSGDRRIPGGYAAQDGSWFDYRGSRFFRQPSGRYHSKDGYRVDGSSIQTDPRVTPIALEMMEKASLAGERA